MDAFLEKRKKNTALQQNFSMSTAEWDIIHQQAKANLTKGHHIEPEMLLAAFVSNFLLLCNVGLLIGGFRVLNLIAAIMIFPMVLVMDFVIAEAFLGKPPTKELQAEISRLTELMQKDMARRYRQQAIEDAHQQWAVETHTQADKVLFQVFVYTKGATPSFDYENCPKPSKGFEWDKGLTGSTESWSKSPFPTKWIGQQAGIEDKHKVWTRYCIGTLLATIEEAKEVGQILNHWTAEMEAQGYWQQIKAEEKEKEYQNRLEGAKTAALLLRNY